MPTRIEHAVVLAAGRGTRMGSMTETLPKPMLAVGDRPMLDHVLNRLVAAGFERFLCVVGYQHEMIENYFSHSKLDLKFELQEPVNGTGSAALLAKPSVGDHPFLLTFGDILCSPDEYNRAVAAMDEETEAVVAVKAVDDPYQGAAVYVENGVITRIVEKPPKGTSTTPWNSAGFYCFRPSIFRYLEALKPSIRNEYELTAALDAMLADGMKLKISAIEGEWRDVGRPEDLAAVNSNVP